MRTIKVGFICVIVMMAINSFVLLFAIDNLADEVREANKANEPVVAAYEEPEEVIVPVYYEKQDDGAMFYTFGDLTMDKYAFGIMIHEGQGIYTYYDYNDHRIECKSLSELQELIMCHIDQAWPNATFVMR